MSAEHCSPTLSGIIGVLVYSISLLYHYPSLFAIEVLCEDGGVRNGPFLRYMMVVIQGTFS